MQAQGLLLTALLGCVLGRRLSDLGTLKSIQDVLSIQPVKSIQEVSSIQEVKNIQPIDDSVAKKAIKKFGLKNQLNENDMVMDTQEAEVGSSSPDEEIEKEEKLVAMIEYKEEEEEKVLEVLKELETKHLAKIEQLEGGLAGDSGSGVDTGEAEVDESGDGGGAVGGGGASVQEISDLQEISKILPISSLQEVKSIQNVKSVQEVKNLYELTPSQAKELLKLIGEA